MERLISFDDYTAHLSNVHTNGWDYTPAQFKMLEELIQEACDAPPLQESREAIVTFQECDPLKYFAGWKMRSLQLKNEHSPPPVSKHQQDYKLPVIGPDTIGSFSQNDDLTYDLQTQEALLTAGARLVGANEDPAKALRVYLLWDNCD